MLIFRDRSVILISLKQQHLLMQNWCFNYQLIA